MEEPTKANMPPGEAKSPLFVIVLTLEKENAGFPMDTLELTAEMPWPVLPLITLPPAISAVAPGMPPPHPPDVDSGTAPMPSVPFITVCAAVHLSTADPR